MYVGMHECDPISPIDNSHKFLPIVTTILSGGLPLLKQCYQLGLQKI